MVAAGGARARVVAGADLAGAALTGVQRAVDVVVDALCATVVAILLLLPWSVAFAAGDGTESASRLAAP